MEFIGFQRDLSVLLWVVSWLLFTGVSLWTYAKTKELQWNQKVILSLLRTATLTLLLVLLLNPIFLSKTTENQSPNFLLLLDKSESTSLLKGMYQGKHSYREVVDVLKAPPVHVEFETYAFGSSLTPFSLKDSLITEDRETRILDAIEQISSLDDPKDGVIMVTDGIITDRNDPSFEIQQLNRPFYVIGLGDTSKVKDLSISEVQGNRLGYFESTHTLNVFIQASGLKDQSSNLRVTDKSGNIIQEVPLRFSSPQQSFMIPISLELREVGLQTYTIRVEEIQGEWTFINNELSTTINVIDNSIEVLHVASSIHPDVGMIRRLIATNPQMNLTTWTLDNDGRILEDLNNLPKTTPDLVVWHGAFSPSSEQLGTYLPYLSDQIPRLYLHLPTPLSRLNNLGTPSDIIPDQWLYSPYGAVQLEQAISNTDHPILESVSDLTATHPPLEALLNSEIDLAQSVLNARYIGDESKISILHAEELNSVRKAYVSAWNWFLFSQSLRIEERNYVDQLFTNLLFWLSNDPNNDVFEITTTRYSYNKFDDVIFNATLQNEQSKADDEASIELIIYRSDDEQNANPIANIQLLPEGQGQYSAAMQLGIEGSYNYQAIVRKKGLEIVREMGEFVLHDSNSEYIETYQNTSLLTKIASNTGGAFFDFTDLDTFWSTLDDVGKLELQTINKEQYWYPVQHILWFIFVLVLLGVEWLLRKWWNLV